MTDVPVGLGFHAPQEQSCCPAQNISGRTGGCLTPRGAAPAAGRPWAGSRKMGMDGVGECAGRRLGHQCASSQF
ncbi:MAG: hypothetical protein ILA34_05765 [Bacteroidaceae bacterium]|nr:hypothetical protein [Bacteroidaceae bacterium]